MQWQCVTELVLFNYPKHSCSRVIAAWELRTCQQYLCCNDMPLVSY